MSEITKLDLYELLAIPYECSQQEISSSYRRLALGCHPDKNPDNAEALQLFHQLSEALKILTDPTAKADYDRLLKIRKANVLRHKKLDQKTQKFRDDLEAREKAAKDDLESETVATDRLKRDIERLRKEGSKQLEKENEFLRQQINEEMKRRIDLQLNKDKVLPKIKIIRKSKTFDFSYESLTQCLSRFGDINGLVLNKNHKKAIIEYNDYKQSKSLYENRHQFKDKFDIQWVGDIPEDEPKEPLFDDKSQSNVTQNQRFSSDYEKEVLLNLRRAEERKKLNKQLEQQIE